MRHLVTDHGPEGFGDVPRVVIQARVGRLVHVPDGLGDKLLGEEVSRGRAGESVFFLGSCLTPASRDNQGEPIRRPTGSVLPCISRSSALPVPPQPAALPWRVS